MGNVIDKKTLSEISLFYGTVNMPKGFEIDRKKLTKDILQSTLHNKEFPFSKSWDMLNTYVQDHVNLEYGFTLIKKNTWGNTYKTNEVSLPLLNIDPVDLKNSPDYTFLYGVKVDKCNVKIYYNDNRRKGRNWDIELKNNEFIMFPSTNVYCVTNNQKDSLNIIQTITYEFI
jgi:hypothetical protein|tara:strand:- start:1906 stop:2421 length:516 start_codon:yes stop_codon:yes gene_type:complete